ncbi:hypothetical protein ACIBF5_24545 [Micromonospora sp. NPDC050417]|uniref:hypothetical protein n=1 Tax=Micromonospora sp. NPDC050417 TaxID=3364280 RepID=UPI0037A156CA
MTISFRALRALRKIRRQVGIPLLGLGVGLIAAQGVTKLLPPTYEASASLVIAAGPSDDSSGREAAALTLAQNLAPTIARLVESREVSRDTAATLRLPEADVAGRIDGEFEPGLHIVTVRASARSASRAAAIANAASSSVSRQLARLRIASGTEVTAEPLDQAAPPTRPSLPKPELNSIFGAVAGLLAGLALISMRNRVDRRLRDLDKIEVQLGLPVLGVFPRLPRRFALRRARTLHSRPEVADAVAATVASLAVLTSSLPRRRLLITSARNEDCKALVATLLALGLAGRHDRVALVDGQSQPPLISGHFPEMAGQALRKTTDGSVAPLAGSTSLTVLAPDFAREQSAGAGEGKDRLGALLNRLADRDDTVIVHGPPVLAGTELSEIAKHVEGVLLVVQRDVTDANEASRAALLVQRMGVPLVGVLVVDGAGEVSPAADIWPTRPVRAGTVGARHLRSDPSVDKRASLRPSLSDGSANRTPSWPGGQMLATSWGPARNPRRPAEPNMPVETHPIERPTRYPVASATDSQHPNEEKS